MSGRQIKVKKELKNRNESSFFRSQKSSKNIILFPFFDTEIERNRIEGKNIDFSDVLYSVVTF